MSLFEAERVGGGHTVHGRFLPQTGINVNGGEEGDGHGEIVETKRVREHGAGEEVSVLQGQGKPVAILALDQVSNLQQ